MEKKPVSDATKAAAAKKAAAAQQAAQAKKATGAATKAAPKKQAAEKAVGEVEQVVAKVADEPKGGGKGGSVKGLRIGAVICWILAIACEVGAFFAFSYAMRNGAQNWNDLEFLLLFGALVLDAIFCIVGAQLWKKANRIRPSLASSALVRTLWHQLGVIMVLVCFLPIGIFLLLKADKLNKKTKTILIALLAVLFASATAASVDFQQPSKEEVAQLQQEAIASAADTVYWTRFGKSYHFLYDADAVNDNTLSCPYLARTVPDNLNSGSLQDAFDANRWDPCDYCAGGADVHLDTDDAG